MSVVLDFETLLRPIEGENSAGVNLRADGGRDLYDRVRGARNQARVKERPQMMGDPNAPAGPPEEWGVVLDGSVEAIAGQSKDLELATYLIEAMVRLHGYAGLAEGFRLYRELLTQYWENGYPPAEEDGAAGRVAALGGLNGDSSRDGALLFPIFRQPLTDGPGGSFAAYQYDYALTLESLPPEKRQEKADEGHPTLEVFTSAARQTTDEYCRGLWNDLEECRKEFDKLVETLDTVCGADAPPSSKIRDALSKCQTIVENLYQDRLKDAPEPAAQEGEDGNGAVAGRSVAGAAAARGALTSREEAFRTIERVADYFRQTEPQSPVIYALEQVVRWGNMPLPELLAELITDDSVRDRLFERIGIRRPGSDGQ
jgi:type VI secretion system protein ImpA